MAKSFVDDVIANNNVAMFSKSYCPFCKMAKSALNETGAKYKVVELDERGIIFFLLITIQARPCNYYVALPCMCVILCMYIMCLS